MKGAEKKRKYDIVCLCLFVCADSKIR